MKNFFVESAAALDGHQLKVRRTDGLESLIGISGLLETSAFAALRDSRLFRDVRIAAE